MPTFFNFTMKKYPEYKQLHLPKINQEIADYWKKYKVFEKSIQNRNNAPQWIFYEGPPSANGLPGIHHVMSRTIKDIFCRYKTMQGYQVIRKAGWDTHGLPVELGVEKELGITKEDIGKKISVEEYNKKCKESVMRYTHKWEQLTEMMGYWIDMKNPYITYDNNYIESVWYLLKQIYNKGLLYKGYTIQPYSPAAGTGLSSHELNQPGCYKNVKDRTAVAMFKLIPPSNQNTYSATISKIFEQHIPIYTLAWTTTPWTLPSNTALAVHPDIDYIAVKTYHPYPENKNQLKKIIVILAKNLLHKYFQKEQETQNLNDITEITHNKLPYTVIAEFKGQELLNIKYEQLLPFVKPEGDAFRIIPGKFVTTEEGTGIVHIAPSFGEDDFKVAKENNIPSLTLVDLKGKFTKEVSDGIFLYGEEPVKEAYLSDEEKEYWLSIQKEKLKPIISDTSKLKYLNVDERIVLKLQTEGKLFKKELYEHNYPHCWRTDKPILYYPLDAWFIKTTAVKDRMIELNKTINWKPESTGSGRFGNWLENLNDWNLSRSRYWGIPLPIWRDKNIQYELIASSKNDLISCKAIRKTDKKEFIAEGYYIHQNKKQKLTSEFLQTFDLHKPFIDNIIFILLDEQQNEITLYRENDLIDVWFDSGSMPYAQYHYPFENKELIDERKTFPADFIAEGVDQTRGWFFTLHAIATMVFDSIAYKNVVSNGLVLDKNGNKMSKRLGNVIDPFETLEKYSADATRWYMISNAAPWDNLKFDINGLIESQRKLFSTLYNTYQFYAMYANVDKFIPSEKITIPPEEKHELDKWILSKLNSLIKQVTEYYNNFEPHKAARSIEEFVDEHLSNWYVRLSRRRFWKNAQTDDKISAYEILHFNLYTLAHLIAPIAPFFADWLYLNLKQAVHKNHSLFKFESIHLSDFPKYNKSEINLDLEEKMFLAQTISSLILSIRKKENIKVRQPLQLAQIPVLNKDIKEKIESVKDIISNEVNVKNIEVVDETKIKIVKNIKLNFKSIGKKYPKYTKFLQQYISDNSQKAIEAIEQSGKIEIPIQNDKIILTEEDVEIIPVDVPGWKIANKNNITVALDITITDDLYKEGLARELVNRIQNKRKEMNFNITDRISIQITSENKIIFDTINQFKDYICTETLCEHIEFNHNPNGEMSEELDKNIFIHISVQTINSLNEKIQH